MRCLIADLVTELHPQYAETQALAAPFLYTGERDTDITLTVTDAYLQDLLSRAVPGTTIGQMENFALIMWCIIGRIDQHIQIKRSKVIHSLFFPKVQCSDLSRWMDFLFFLFDHTGIMRYEFRFVFFFVDSFQE